MELRPGMRVRIEYETELDPCGTDKVQVKRYPPAYFHRESGQPVNYGTSDVASVKITPIEETFEVTVKVTGVGVTESEVLDAVANALPKRISWPYTGNRVELKARVEGRE